jgi:hypothetical protein
MMSTILLVLCQVQRIAPATTRSVVGSGSSTQSALEADNAKLLKTVERLNFKINQLELETKRLRSIRPKATTASTVAPPVKRVSLANDGEISARPASSAASATSSGASSPLQHPEFPSQQRSRAATTAGTRSRPLQVSHSISSLTSGESDKDDSVAAPHSAAATIHSRTTTMTGLPISQANSRPASAASTRRPITATASSLASTGVRGLSRSTKAVAASSSAVPSKPIIPSNTASINTSSLVRPPGAVAARPASRSGTAKLTKTASSSRDSSPGASNNHRLSANSAKTTDSTPRGLPPSRLPVFTPSKAAQPPKQ